MTRDDQRRGSVPLIDFSGAKSRVALDFAFLHFRSWTSSFFIDNQFFDKLSDSCSPASAVRLSTIGSPDAPSRSVTFPRALTQDIGHHVLKLDAVPVPDQDSPACLESPCQGPGHPACPILCPRIQDEERREQ